MQREECRGSWRHWRWNKRVEKYFIQEILFKGWTFIVKDFKWKNVSITCRCWSKSCIKDSFIVLKTLHLLLPSLTAEWNYVPNNCTKETTSWENLKMLSLFLQPSSNKIHHREELRKDKANFLKIIYMKRSDIKENKGNDFISSIFLPSSTTTTQRSNSHELNQLVIN